MLKRGYLFAEPSLTFLKRCMPIHLNHLVRDKTGIQCFTEICELSYYDWWFLPFPEPPWSSIYPKSDPQLNVKNTLICHVTGFFPPPVRVSWTKNNVNVTDESTLSRYYPNKDGTLNVFSRLSFIPEKEDIYSCSVEHKALQQPQTRVWGGFIFIIHNKSPLKHNEFHKYICLCVQMWR